MGLRFEVKPPYKLSSELGYVCRSCDEPYLVVIIKTHDEHVFRAAIQGWAVLEEEVVCGAFSVDIRHKAVVLSIILGLKFNVSFASY